ncbi:hypothetical protein TWF730_004667 [Orbilia blumenaviensis]|uniref:SET domain-containing protein n=1 Tax=Orbilia blumenaviensis TaxID=1796055 RepID=A0AAV9TYT4_9PEZI
MSEPTPASKRPKLDPETGRRYSEHQKLHELAEWVIQSGGYVSDVLELYKDEESGFSASITCSNDGSSRSAEAPVTLVSCPKSLIFSLANPTPTFTVSAPGFPSLSIHAKACFHLCQHLLLKEKSPFWPYIRLLPETFDTPLYFSDDEMERLAGTNLGAGDVALRKQIWTEEWETGRQILEQTGGIDNSEEYTWDLYLRAATIYTSRSFPSKLVGIAAGSTVIGPTQSPDYDDDFPVLIPLVDILNHKPNTKIIWEPTSASFSLKTPEILPVGSQVFNNYGPKGNEELVMGYGFAIPNNPTDSLAMKFTISPRGQAAEIWEQRRLRQEWKEVFHLTKSKDFEEDMAIHALEDDWPGALVDLFRILVANESEIDDLENGDLNTTPISTRNELAVALGLRAAINQKLAAIRKYDISLTSPATSYREKLIDTYRQGQENIIVSKIQRLDKFLEYYARDRLLSLDQYLSDNAELRRQLDQNPIPVEEIEGEDGPFYEEIIAKEELIFITALLRECLTPKDANNPPSGSEGFWITFSQYIYSTPGTSFDDFAKLNKDLDDESEGIYEAIAAYCNLVDAESAGNFKFIGSEVNSTHISWAWGIVRAKCITIGEDIFLTI